MTLLALLPAVSAFAFQTGLLEPGSPRLAAHAARLGLAAAAELPAGAAAVESATPDGRTADWAALRLAAARAVVQGASGVYFTPVPLPPGKDLLDFPEELQALTRAARELQAMTRVIESKRVGLPFEAAVPIEAAAWRSGSRTYVLLVNAGFRPAPIDGETLKPWRALFEPRADPRQRLLPCGQSLCLPPRAVLWLESAPY